MGKNKKLLTTVMTSKVWLSVFFVLVIILLFHSVSLFIKRERVWKKVGALKKEKQTLVEQKASIDTKNRNITEGIGKEAIFREKFNVVKPGEDVIILTEDNEIPATEQESSGFWSKILHFLKIDR